MNAPNNMKQFDLQMAIAGHPLVTREGKAAKFAAYVPQNEEFYTVIVCVDGRPKPTNEVGKYCEGDSDYDLFLAPLGYCEGKPVFAGDVLIGSDSNKLYKGKEFIVQLKCNNFELFKWPSKIPVVETKISHDEMCSIYYNGGPVVGYKEETLGWYRIANKAIERAIMDGDVIPTSVVEKLMRDVCDYPNSLVPNTINEYLKGLK